MILAGQVQFYEMEKAGVSYVMEPKQVVFTYNQFDVVNGVLDGTYDVGFIRTDQIERGLDSEGNPLDTSLFNVIQPKIYVMEDGDMFPFLHSTDIFPEFAFGTLPGVTNEVAEEVQNALFALGDHAEAAEGLEACYAENTRDHCDSLPFLETFAPHAGCDTTQDLAWLALNATRAGKLAGFRTARSYASVRTMHEAGGFMLKDDKGRWQCTRATNLYEGIHCPTGYIKVDEDTFTNNCDMEGLACKEGYDCFCKPCQLEIDVYPTTSNESSLVDGENQADCSKDALCTSVEQTKSIVLQAYDNSHREEITVRAVMTVAGAVQELPVRHVEETSTYEFLVSHTKLGIANIDVYANDVPLPLSPFQVEITPRNCQGDYQGQARSPTEDGKCICDGGYLEISGTCYKSVAIFCTIGTFLIVIAGSVAMFYMRHKRNLSDQIWLVNVEELHFDSPLDVIGQGSFGQVVLAEYRGTKVAIKRVIRPDKKQRDGQRGSVKSFNGGSFAGNGGSFAGASKDEVVDDGRSSKTDSEEANMPEATDGSVDIETGKSIGSYGGTFSGTRSTGTGQVDLDMLAKFDGGRHSKWCPGGKRDDHRGMMKSSILGTSTGGSTSRSSVAHYVFSCFDKQNQRKQEFMQEMRLLSRLRHPCITTVMGAVLSPFHDPMLVMEYMEYGR